MKLCGKLCFKHHIHHFFNSLFLFFFCHRITVSLRLEGTSRGHLAQSHRSKQDELEQIEQSCVELALYFLNTSIDTLCPLQATHRGVQPPYSLEQPGQNINLSKRCPSPWQRV